MAVDVVWRVDVEPFFDKLPSPIQFVGGPRHFEVIDVDDQEQVHAGLKVARRPLRANGLEANAAYMSVAMLLPEGPAVGVPVQRLLQLHDRFVECSELGADDGVIRPCVDWEVDPARCPFEVRLNVGSWRVRNLGRMAQNAAKGVASARRLQRSWAAT